MKEIFAKIFELEDFQVLITKQFENEEDETEYHVVQTTMVTGVEFNMSLVYTDRDKANEIFNTYSENDARAFIEQIRPCFLQ